MNRHVLPAVISGLLMMMATCLAAPALDPGGDNEFNFVLSNLTTLWEEVEKLQHDVMDHRKGDPPHDQVIHEVDVMKHEQLVHHLQRPHEGHNDHHEHNLLQHLENFHDHNDDGHDDHDHDGHDDHHHDGHDDDHHHNGHDGHHHDGHDDHHQHDGHDDHHHDGHDNHKHDGHDDHHYHDGHDNHKHDGHDDHHHHDGHDDDHKHDGHDDHHHHDGHDDHHHHDGHDDNHHDGHDDHHHDGHDDHHHDEDHDHCGDTHDHDHDHHHHHHDHGRDAHDRHGLHTPPDGVPLPNGPVMVGPALAPKVGLALIPGKGEPAADQGEEWMHASCSLEPNADLEGGSVRGTVVISQKKDESGPVFFHIDIRGFKPSQGNVHGFHIHQSPVTDSKCATAGGHFNPFDTTHGAPDSPTRHVGDLGNIEVDSKGKLEDFILSDDQVAFSGPSSIIGKSIVIHSGEDDLGLGGDEGSLSTGNAGGRLACCTIHIQAELIYRFKG